MAIVGSQKSQITLNWINLIGNYVSARFNFLFILYALLSGYGFAWVGHFFIEKNKPATFKYPFYSFIGDYKMYFEILQGKHKIF